MLLKDKKYDTWIAMWLNHFKIDVIWTAFKGFLKLHSHISVFWGFSWISVIFEFSFLGIELKQKPGNHRKPLFYRVFFSKFIKFAFVFVFLHFYWQNLWFSCTTAISVIFDLAYAQAVGLIQDTVICLQLCHCWIRITASCLSGKDLTDDFTDKPISRIFYYQHKT